MDMSNFQQQHQDLAEAIARIDRLVQGKGSGNDLSKELIGLGGKLTVHLAAEDKFLYPRLRTATDQTLIRMTDAFATEMGGLAGTFKTFYSQWCTPARCDAARGEFERQWRTIASALRQRVEREERDLYPRAAAL